MTAPRIVFHAGFHKTGTTSLQTALRQHRTALAPLFAVETRASSPALLAAAEAARALSIDPGHAAALDQALADWTAGLALAPGQGLLVSCEDFAGHMPGRFGLPDYRAAIPIARAIQQALRTRFGQLPKAGCARSTGNCPNMTRCPLARAVSPATTPPPPILPQC